MLPGPCWTQRDLMHYTMHYNMHCIMQNIIHYNIQNNMHCNMHIASYACYRDPAGPTGTLCITLCLTICITLCITLYITLCITICITICISSVMHAAGTLWDPTGPNYTCYRDPMGPCRTHRDPAGGEEEKDFSVPPALATAESRPRAHTASRRDHVTDMEHDFPVWEDGQAGLTPPTSNLNSAKS